MNIVLVNGDWRYLRRKWPPRAKERYFPGNSEPLIPLELAYIGGILKDRYPVQIIDLNLPETSPLKVTYLKDQQDLIFILTTAPNYLFWRCPPLSIKTPLNLCGEFRRLFPGSKIVVIGPHGSVRPTDFLKEADFVLMGEPEFAVLKLVEMLCNKRKNAFSEVDGIAFHEGNKFFISNRSAVVENLDGLPFPAYQMFHLQSYSAHNLPPGFNYTQANPCLLPLSTTSRGKPRPGTYWGRHAGTGACNYLSVLYEASRGCPFNCIFCFKNRFRNAFRVKNVDKVIRELKVLKEEFGVSHIYFIDETFGLRTEWTYDLCAKMVPLSLKWSCQSRFDAFTPNLITKMAEAGCISIEFGLESGSQQILEKTAKKLVREGIQQILEACIQVGITPSIFLLLGLPGETKGTVEEARVFMERLPVRKCRFSGAAFPIPYPETSLWRVGIEEGKIKGDSWCWEDLPDVAGTIGNSFTRREISKIVRDFNYSFRSHRHNLLGRLVLKTKFILKYG
ncbi:MAG: hypothetical protein COX46_02970 [bacterium (Candidatus Ratteibacteria) CG23_combo_of_CG06-09_8_20_14_all_48_7]|uniref:Radical SAM core domain-containing protein n=1 Tax=bacterium (Candidatus Ratteibacteria) CG23_combo_of_CG06-09_8_20_14_all_48_7 TaxID=2014292 RepID=A0A2G9YCT1_9BACT|nr:MAG: hypothetical protein COX46_02970 [bacterium (Candidatus Ratteibacteria) CG23_combo_of_CG06-09_8_20_14_all_48_7]